MKTNKNLKDEFYIINQPKHALISIVLVDTDSFPIDENLHNNLEKLNRISDILFIFDENTFPQCKSINKESFSALYESNSWVISKGNHIRTLVNSFEYSLEILKSHKSFLVFNLSDLTITDEDLDRINIAAASPLDTAVLKIDRLSSREFYSYYSSISNGIFGKEFSDENRYSSYKSSSRIVFLRNWVAYAILNFIKTEDGEKYISTFKNKDCRRFIASIIKCLGINYLNSNIEDVQI